MSSLKSVRLLATDFEASYRFYADSMQLPVLYGDQNGPYAEFGDESGLSLAIFQKNLMLDMLKDEGGEAEPTDDFISNSRPAGLWTRTAPGSAPMPPKSSHRRTATPEASGRPTSATRKAFSWT